VRQRTGATRLGQDHLSGDRPDPGDRIQPGDRGCQLAELALDAGLHGGDVGGDAVDALQHPGQQEGVVVGEPAGQRLDQPVGLRAQRAAGQAGQCRRVALAGDQRGHDRPPGDPERVADHHRQFDQGVFEQLLGPLLLRGAGDQQIHPVAGQVPQGPDLWRRHEGRAQHLPLGDLAQPHRIQPVGLGSAGQVLDVFGVDQPGLEPVLQQVERRPPVVAGRLHHHPGHPEVGQPIAQRQQRGRHRGDGANLLHPLTVRSGHPHAADHLGLADIQRGDPLDDLALVDLDPHDPRLLGAGVEAATRRSCRGNSEANPRARSTRNGPQHSSRRPTVRRPQGPSEYDVNG
jgi:hypothetical protein